MLRKSIAICGMLAVLLGGCKKPFASSGQPNPAASSPSPATGATLATPAATNVSENSALSEKPAANRPQIDERARVVVLGYHRLVQKVRMPGTEITPADFEAQMQQLKEQGIAVISMQDFLAWKRGAKSIPARSAIITLDDGWRSQYEVAFPILKKYGYPFTLFIYTNYVKGGPKSGGESLSWEELAQMRDAGADIEGHTVSHADLRGPRHHPRPDYEAWLWNELAGSKQLLEQKLGVKINALAVPYGYYNQHVKDIAALAGYEAIFTVDSRDIGYSTPLNSLGRFIIDARKPQIFASAVRSVSPAPGTGPAGESAPAVAELNAASLSVEPADGSVVSDPQPLIRASLGNTNPIDPKSASMRISGFGIVNAKYDSAANTISYRPVQKLKMSGYTVIVAAKSQGKRIESRWTFFVGAPNKPVAEPPLSQKPLAVEPKKN